MKNLKNTISKVILVFTTVLLGTACKKDKDRSTISTEALVDYQIVMLLKSPTKSEVRAVFFAKSDNKIIARLVGLESDHAQTVSMNNNTITISDNTTKASFKISLKEDNGGNISISGINYTTPDDTNMKVDAFYMTKTEGMFPINNSHYGGPATLTFTASNWRYGIYANAVGNYAAIDKGAWKGTIAGGSFMGISIKDNNRWYMVLQKGVNGYDIFYLI